VWQTSGQPLLTSTSLSLVGHIAPLDDNIDTKKILTAIPPEDWKRRPSHPRITWIKTVLNDLESHNLTFTFLDFLMSLAELVDAADKILFKVVMNNNTYVTHIF